MGYLAQHDLLGRYPLPSVKVNNSLASLSGLTILAFAMETTLPSLSLSPSTSPLFCVEKCPYERGFGSLGPGQKAWAEPQELKLMAPFPSHHAEGKVILTLMICFERPGIIYILCSKPLYGTYYVSSIIPNASQTLTHSIFVTPL